MKKFLVMTDIEGVTGVTTFAEAENSEVGRAMLMNDLNAVLRGIYAAGCEAVVYDMHTDGRNIDLSELDAPVVRGKPILESNWRGVGGDGFDGLFMVGLHTMQHTGALLAHSYLKEYDSIHLNGLLIGEIGMEAALAGELGIPLKFVSGDDMGCREAEKLIPGIITCSVKTSLGDDTAICCPPKVTSGKLEAAAKAAASASVMPFALKPPYEIKIKFSDCKYLSVMRSIHPEIFENQNTAVMRGDNLLKVWSEYLKYEKEMVTK